MKKTVMITGCAGLLGSHFTRHLLKKGYRVIGFDDLSGGYADYLPKSNELRSHDCFEFWPIDLSESRSSEDLSDAITNNPNKPEACFHFAAYASEGLSPFIRSYNYRNNVIASTNVINACINYGIKLIFTSSMAVYGDQESPFFEDMQPAPIDPYGVAKYTVEMDIKIANTQHGLRYNILRPHNVVGIYQNIWDRYRNVAGIFIRKAINNEPLLVYGDGNQTRSFSDIRFCMEPFEKLIGGGPNLDCETFNIGADRSWSINELASVVQKVARDRGFDPQIKHVEPRHEVYAAHCDHSKAQELLGFEDHTDLESLITEMFDWSMKQPKREVKDMKYEIVKGMYEFWL